MSASLAAAAFALWNQRRKIALAVLRQSDDDNDTAPAPSAEPDEPVRFGRKRGGRTEGGPPDATPAPLSFGRRGPSKNYSRVVVDLDLDDIT